MKTFKTTKGTEIPLQDIKGKPYMAVAHRLVWFNEEETELTIETEIITHNADYSVCRAYIKDLSGRIIRTAVKQENKQGFADHLEKAETGAIGRALGLLGYGTQYAHELDEGVRLADAPVEQPKKLINHAPQAPQYTDDAKKGAEYVKTSKKITEAQLKRLYAIQAKSTWTPEHVKAMMKHTWDIDSAKDLNMLRYESLIHAIQELSPPLLK